MGSRVQCDVYWNSFAVEAGSTESGETVVLEAEADQGVAPVIVMPAAPKIDRRRYVTKSVGTKTSVKRACSWRQACTIAKVPHDDRCRDRIGELMAEDDDQRRVERASSRAVPEVEFPRLEAGEEMDVGEPTVHVVALVEDQPVPTVRVGGSSSSGTRAGSGSRANEANTDDRDTKRVRFTESRGLKRQGEDVEEMVAKADEQHLDADEEVPAHKTWRVDDGVADAADAAPKQMNSVAAGAQLYIHLLEYVARRPTYVRLALWFLHPPALVEGHTGGSRLTPTVHPCPVQLGRLWVAYVVYEPKEPR